MSTHLTVQHGYYFSGKVIGLSVFAVTKLKMSNSLPTMGCFYSNHG